MVTKPSTEQTQDFSIHNEDFPALPGPNYKDPTLSNDDSKTVSMILLCQVSVSKKTNLVIIINLTCFWLCLVLCVAFPQNLNSTGKSSSNSDGPKFPGDKTSSAQNNNQKKGIQVLPDGKTSHKIVSLQFHCDIPTGAKQWGSVDIDISYIFG